MASIGFYPYCDSFDFRFSVPSMFLLPRLQGNPDPRQGDHRDAAFGIGNGMVSCDLVSEKGFSAVFEDDSQQDSIIFF